MCNIQAYIYMILIKGQVVLPEDKGLAWAAMARNARDNVRYRAVVLIIFGVFVLAYDNLWHKIRLFIETKCSSLAFIAIF